MGRQPEVDEPTGSGSKWIPTGWARVGFWFCTVIAIAVVVRRVIALISPPHNAPPELAALDAVFGSHAALTLAHILPALAFVVIAPLAVFWGARAGAWVERLLFPLGAWVGLTAYAMSRWADGRSGRRSWSSTRFFCIRCFRRSRQSGGGTGSKAGMVAAGDRSPAGDRDDAAGDGNLFRDQPSTHLTPNQFFGIAFWIGFSINTVVIEWWLRARARGGESKADTERSAA